MSIARRIILDELIENSHIEDVSDVIYWALDEYNKRNKTNGAIVSSSIVTRIKEAEKKNVAELQNLKAISQLESNTCIYCLGVSVLSENGKYYWTIETNRTDLDNLDEYEEISKELYNELMKHRNK